MNQSYWEESIREFWDTWREYPRPAPKKMEKQIWSYEELLPLIEKIEK